MLPAVLLLKAAAKSFAGLNLSGGDISDTQADPINTNVTWHVDQDGKMYNADTFSGLVVHNEDSDWIIPHTDAPGAYQVRWTGHTGDAMTSFTLAEDSWHALSSSDFTLNLQRSTVGNYSNSFTFEIRSGTGPVLFSNVYTMSATVT